METSALEFLKRLLDTPGPSGYEQRIQKVVRDYVQDFVDQTTTDLHGNVIASVNSKAERRVMFAGHCDQIGMLVSHIDAQGFIYAQTIGGWDPQQLVGQRMVIWTDQGEVPAVISRKPIHLLSDDERKQVVKIEDLWLDIGSQSYEESAELVRIGDPVTLQLGFQPLRNNLANAPGMDNRTGVWVVCEALRRISIRNQASGHPSPFGVFAVSTVQEEIGLRGAKTSAFGIDPEIGIAVDVTHATDCPGIDQRQRGVVGLGQGPVVFRGPNMNPRVSERLSKTADSNQIPFQDAAIGRATPNDTNSLQVNRAGVATGLVAIPNRYMHSAVETISLDDLDYAADLLAEFVVSLQQSDDFTP